MTPLIDHLADVCDRCRLEEKWLLAPTRRVAQQWLDRVTAAGGRVVNVRVKTVAGLAAELLADRLAAEGRALATPAQRSLAVAAAWARAMASGEGYLAPLKATPRLLGVVERSIHDLRHAGLGPGHLADKDFEEPLKGRELAALLAAYERELESRKLIDHADALRLAASMVGGDGPLLLVPGDLRLAALERHFVDAFGPGRIVPLAVEDPDALRARLEEGALTSSHAVGEANEVREVFRACLAGETPLDQVEVVYTASVPYVTLLYETAQRALEPDDSLDLGVAVTFEEGVPARVSRPGRLLEAWLNWIEDGFTQLGLFRIIQANLVEVPAAGGPVSAGAVARTLRRLPIGLGRERFLAVIDNEIVANQRAAAVADEDDSDEQRAAAERRTRERGSLQALRALTEGLLALCPAPGTHPRETVEAALALLRDRAHCPSRLDRLARQHMVQEVAAMVEALESAPGPVPAGFDVVAWLLELPRRARVGGHGPLPGHLHVAGLRTGGHSGRARTFVVGLDDGRFPPAGLQDPLVLDGERERLGSGLPTSNARLEEAMEDFRRLLCRLPGPVRLSYSSRDVADGRETFASPVVRDLALPLDPQASFAPLRPEACLDAGEWWMSQGVADPLPQALEGQLATSYPHLERGRLASEARASDRFTPFDGLVEQAGPELDPRNRVKAVSASRLQVLGKCPLRYFYRYVLGIRPPDDLAVDAGEWLDALEFGKLLHEVLYEFVSELITEGVWPPERDRDAARMAVVVERRLARWRQIVPPPGDDPYDRQRKRLERACEIFVNEQGGARREPHGRPRYLEAALGTPPEGAGTPIDTLDPIEVDLDGAGRILVTARLDRIDVIERPGTSGAPPRFGIIDYKSGRYVKPYDPPDLYGQGRLVQHVLYMTVLEAALEGGAAPGAVADGFTFLFPDVRTHGRPVVFGRDIVPGGLEVVAKLCAMAGRGAFPATDDVKLEDCRHCEYEPACRSVSPDLRDICASTARKRPTSADGDLKEFVELRLAR